jgi:hypothetical protein
MQPVREPGLQFADRMGAAARWSANMRICVWKRQGSIKTEEATLGSAMLVRRNKRSALRHLGTLRRGALFRIRYGRRAISLAAQCAALIAPYGSYPPFAFRPISTRRRIASERVTPFAVAHASKLVMNSSESRKVREASLPVAGRPRLLGIAFFVDAFILMQYLK